jgi:hypothetical protein
VDLNESMEIVMSERFADTTNTPTRGITDEPPPFC